MTKTKTNIDVRNNMLIVNMSQVALPQNNETVRTEWVPYGPDNAFPCLLQDLMNKSAIHNAIISSKVDHICGGGLTYEDDPKTAQFLSAVNPEYGMEELIRRLAYDYTLYGGYAINVIMSKDGKKVAEMWHEDFSKIRSGKQNRHDKVETYFYSKNWQQVRKEENAPEQIPAYDAKSAKGSQLIFVKEYRPGTDYYPMPSYVGALSYIEVDVEIANYHLAHLKNGMQPSIMINFKNGIPTDEERKKIDKQIREKYNGTDNAGKFILTFSEDKDKAPSVEVLGASDLDKQFIQLQDTVIQNILSGHKIVSPMLIGIKTEGQLGGANELENAHMLYINTVIEPARNVIMRTINQVMAKNGLNEVDVKNESPIGFTWSEKTLAGILSVNEMREKAGYAPIGQAPVPSPESLLLPISEQSKNNN